MSGTRDIANKLQMANLT